MKLNEIKNFSESISILFKHFKKYNIHSIIMPEANLDFIFVTIMNAEFLEFHFDINNNHYIIDFKISEKKLHNKIYQFICHNYDKSSEFDLLLDFMVEPSLSFLSFHYSLSDHPPFIHGLLDDNDYFAVHDYSEQKIIKVLNYEILSLDSFHEFIGSNLLSGNVTIVEIK